MATECKGAVSTTFSPDAGNDAARLAAYGGWSETFYRDLLAFEAGRLRQSELIARHGWRRAILVVDFAGTTEFSLRRGDVKTSLRLLAAQRVALPLLESFAPSVLRCFADNLVALFPEPRCALDAAVALRDHDAAALPPCRFGIGNGPVLAIGPNRAQGREMNQASKLGEDFGRPGEILLTPGAYRGLRREPDLAFEALRPAGLPFTSYRLVEVGGCRRGSKQR